MDTNGALTGCTIEQRKWVIARLAASSDAEAARMVGIHPTTVCRWENKADLDAAVIGLLENPRRQAMEMILDAVPRAARVKTEGLDSRSEKIRQDAAGDLLDRVLGKPTQKQELSGPGGGALVIAIGGIDPDTDI